MLRKKNHGIHEFVNREEIILRDHLALERTRLANERTFMAYIRTALYILLGAIAFLKLTDFENIRWTGFVMIPLSLLISVIGLIRYIYLRNHLKKYYKQYNSLPERERERE